MQTLNPVSPREAVKFYKVNSHLLLGLYVIIPICLVIAALDYVLFDKAILNTFLPVTPTQWAFWAIVFNFPHIVSSLITLADKEYITFYKARFSKALLIITLSVMMVIYIIPALFPGAINTIISSLFFVFFATYTVYHVLSQQFGIGLMLMRVKQTYLYQCWRVAATVAGTCLYFIVFAKTQLETMAIMNVSAVIIMQVISGIFTVFASVFALMLLRQSNRKLGTLYVFSNILMLYSTWLFMYLGYTVFVIMIPRFVHDITAFIIYSTHDQNRNAIKQKNYLYRFLSFLPFPPFVLCPLLAISLANSIESGAGWLDELISATGYPRIARISLMIIFVSGFFHYYIEAFVWKREAIHRHSVGFS